MLARYWDAHKNGNLSGSLSNNLGTMEARGMIPVPGAKGKIDATPTAENLEEECAGGMMNWFALLGHLRFFTLELFSSKSFDCR